MKSNKLSERSVRKQIFTVCLDPRDIRRLEQVASMNDLSPRTMARALLLRELRAELKKLGLDSEGVNDIVC